MTRLDDTTTSKPDDPTHRRRSHERATRYKGSWARGLHASYALLYGGFGFAMLRFPFFLVDPLVNHWGGAVGRVGWWVGMGAWTGRAGG